MAAGELGGRRLAAPRGIRPTQGLVRAAIFNVLGSEVDGAGVLDLFAGSGALGIEALSRGAARATFVDHDDSAIQAIRSNLRDLQLEGSGSVVRADVIRWLTANPTRVKEASLILMDPPYNDAILERALSLLDALVGDDATVAVEHAHKQALPALRRLRAGRQRRYGDTAVSFMLS